MTGRLSVWERKIDSLADQFVRDQPGLPIEKVDLHLFEFKLGLGGVFHERLGQDLADSARPRSKGPDTRNSLVGLRTTMEAALAGVPESTAKPDRLGKAALREAPGNGRVRSAFVPSGQEILPREANGRDGMG